jgi:hypothetical protein
LEIAELKEALKSEEALRLYYEKELERINQLPYSQGEQKMQLLDRFNYFLEETMLRFIKRIFGDRNLDEIND